MASDDEGRLADLVRDHAVPVADPLGAEILDVEVKGQPGRRVVRVVADVADLDAAGGLDIDTIATLSRRLGKALDEHDVVPGAYNLEVTSPGADRALRRPRDFVRNIGRDVRIVRDERFDGDPVLVGTLVAATDEGLTLDIDGTEVTLPMAEVDHGKVVLPW